MATPLTPLPVASRAPARARDVAMLVAAFMAALIAAPVLAQAGSAAPAASAAISPDSSPAERRNWFDDPFLQATHGLPGCPVPDAPLLTEAEMIHESHWRAERGTSCFRSGRCRLPNAYLYDKEIAPRVVQAIQAATTFDDTSVWVIGQRRWVWLEGCVSTPAQAQELERIVRLIDDVEAVIPQLIVGTAMPPGTPVYRLAPRSLALPAPDGPAASGPAQPAPPLP